MNDPRQPSGPVEVRLVLTHKAADRDAWAALRGFLKRALRDGKWRCVAGEVTPQQRTSEPTRDTVAPGKP